MRRYLIIAAMLIVCGCSQHSALSASTVPPVDDAALIVPGARVGKFTLERDTLSSILGVDSPQVRNQFAEQGLFFQFERGVQLTGITVSSATYSTQEGLRVGSSPGAVEAAYGEPASRVMHEVHGKFDLPVLSYPGIVFYLKNGAVCAIAVLSR